MKTLTLGTALFACTAALLMSACGGSSNEGDSDTPPTEALLDEGRQIFRYDSFGDELQWTDTLRMHEVIATSVAPATALAVGLKVDADALPASLVDALKRGAVDLQDPATTVALLKLDAVVGLKAGVETVGGRDVLRRVGITCALCHSTVDDSLAKGIGRRLDGWANRDLDPGAILALSPAVDASMKAVFRSWGKGRFDPRHNIDGLSGPVVIPPAYGLQGVHSITYTGDGADLAYWNRYVAVAEMGGQGSVSEPRLKLSITHGSQDLVSGKLAALQAYQLSLKTPAAPAGSFDAAAAVRGKLVFEGAGRCVSCHGGAQFSDANTRLHPAADSMAEPESPSYAARSATRQYRATPLRALWQHAPYFHDGSAATLEDVAARYNQRQSLGLNAQQLADLAQYLRSL